MAEAVVSGVMQQLISIIDQETQQGVKLVFCVHKEVKKLRSNLEAIEVVLVDAEDRQVKEKNVRLWPDRLKQASYDIEDVLDEWNYAILKQKVDGTFPKKKWEEWDHEITRIGEEEEEVIAIMSSLVFLRVHYCPKLKALPKQLVQSTRLEKNISFCPLLGYPRWRQ
ncbi:putative disease resistance protein RGA3 [Mangifera indica]|uniref:putative disease resistance protein RGA3 n=1 Tax=Mangifera indica TaxID=29780 RepID=UPI001CFAC153|nr:putative disease resistance protein RGA3 [Mangifera indica]